MELQLKICGVRHQAHALGLLEPNYLGFIFYQGSPRFFNGTIDGVSNQIKRVGVFVNEHPSKMLELKEIHKLDILQLHGEEPVEECELLGKQIEVWKVFGIDQDFNFDRLKPYLPVVDKFLFDTKSTSRGGTGRNFDWEKLDHYPFDKPFVLSGGIGPEHAKEIKELKQRFPLMHGVDINSRFETAPAIKDIELIKRFQDELSR